MTEYVAPDFDVTIYEVEDIITTSFIFGDQDPDGDGWWG